MSEGQRASASESRRLLSRRETFYKKFPGLYSLKRNLFAGLTFAGLAMIFIGLKELSNHQRIKALRRIILSYLVLARKYRPAIFEQVIGQQHITQTLSGALASGRVAHAFCFTGPRGVGKTSVARILAKALNCENGPTAAPCGVCAACREIDEGRAVDVQEIDAASNSGVEDVRELREMIRYRPQAWRYRVTILDEVHMLSKQAFNALLKTLEEPPEHAVFILATTDVHKLPATILSRCQRYDFRRLSPKLLAQHLAEVCKAEAFELEEQSLMLLAHEADGSTRDALSLLDQVLSYGQASMSHQQVLDLLGLVDKALVTECAGAIMQGNAPLLLDIIEQVYQAGGEMQAFYGSLEEHFRNLAAALAIPAGQALMGLTAEELDALRARAVLASPETIHEIFAHLAGGEEMFRRAQHPRLVMEMILLKLTQIKPVLSLGHIIEMLEKAPEITPEQAAELSARPPARAQEIATTAVSEAGAKNEVKVAATTADNNTKPSSLSPGSAQNMVRQLANYIVTAEPALAACLRQAEAQLQDGSMKIELKGGGLLKNYCSAEKQAAVNKLAAELWDNPPHIELSLVQVEAPPQNNNRMSIQEACNNPAVRAAMEILQAEPVEVRPWVERKKIKPEMVNSDSLDEGADLSYEEEYEEGEI